MAPTAAIIGQLASRIKSCWLRGFGPNSKLNNRENSRPPNINIFLPFLVEAFFIGVIVIGWRVCLSL